jgi:hypothetical protein
MPYQNVEYASNYTPGLGQHCLSLGEIGHSNKSTKSNQKDSLITWLYKTRHPCGVNLAMAAISRARTGCWTCRARRIKCDGNIFFLQVLGRN